jgi:Tat protein translocase TatB subunit
MMRSTVGAAERGVNAERPLLRSYRGNGGNQFMFGTLGGPELFLIFVVALIIFGPRKLPEIGKSLGKMMAEFRKASNEFRSTIESEVEAEKIRDAMRIEPPRYGGTPSGAPAAGGSSAFGGEPPRTDALPPLAAGGADKASSAAEGSPDTPATEPAVPETVSRQSEPGATGTGSAEPVVPK